MGKRRNRGFVQTGCPRGFVRRAQKRGKGEFICVEPREEFFQSG
jgi:hypothetical protein